MIYKVAKSKLLYKRGYFDTPTESAAQYDVFAFDDIENLVKEYERSLTKRRYHRRAKPELSYERSELSFERNEVSQIIIQRRKDLF